MSAPRRSTFEEAPVPFLHRSSTLGALTAMSLVAVVVAVGLIVKLVIL